MKGAVLAKTIGTGLMFCGLMLVHPFSVAAQEATPAQQEKPAGKMNMPGMRGHEHMPCMTPEMHEMHEMHERMEGMQQEMTRELQKQLAALREQTTAMEGISDEKQLLTELRKHQQMTDTLLGTMIEQRDKMHARMKEHHEHMQDRMSKTPQAEKQESEEHEAHHDEE